MASTIQVEAARTPDRDRLLGLLAEAELDARPVDELGLAVRCGRDEQRTTDEIYEQAERLILSIGAPFVPIVHEGTIYIRPPLS
jgi:hypothetical protein